MREMRQTQRHYSLDEYLILEQMSNIRHEYFDGEMFAMSGGSANHIRITKNLVNALDAAADGGCEAYFTDLRVSTPSGLFTYPDVLLIYGPIAYSSDDPLAATNPVVVAEVLSNSTRDYDRGQKFDLYKSISTLRDYLLVDQYKIDVEHRFLKEGRWVSNRLRQRGDMIQLVGVNLVLRVDDLYQRVDFSLPPHHQ